jgi:hypothetical protein
MEISDDEILVYCTKDGMGRRQVKNLSIEQMEYTKRLIDTFINRKLLISMERARVDAILKDDSGDDKDPVVFKIK